MKVHNNKKFLDRRREFRKRPTPQEKILWIELRNNKLGHRFRRQHSIGGYILDFYCFSRRLIIELDGESHAVSKEYDRARDEYFRQLGYRTIRITNREIEKDLQSALERITLSLRLGEGRDEVRGEVG